MAINAVAKSAAIWLLAAGLAGCVDATVDVEITSQTTARATLTQVMGAEFYTMMTLRAERAGTDDPPQGGFCKDGVLSENEDGSASCVLTTQGAFADLSLGEGQQMLLTFTTQENGMVRVALPTDGLASQVGRSDALDAETEQMVEALLAGRKLTLRFSGVAVSETNMVLSEDATAAEQIIPLLDLVRGKLELPKEFYAVVQAP